MKERLSKRVAELIIRKGRAGKYYKAKGGYEVTTFRSPKKLKEFFINNGLRNIYDTR